MLLCGNYMNKIHKTCLANMLDEVRGASTRNVVLLDYLIILIKSIPSVQYSRISNQFDWIVKILNSKLNLTSITKITSIQSIQRKFNKFEHLNRPNWRQGNTSNFNSHQFNQFEIILVNSVCSINSIECKNKSIHWIHTEVNKFCFNSTNMQKKDICNSSIIWIDDVKETSKYLPSIQSI